MVSAVPESILRVTEPIVDGGSGVAVMATNVVPETVDPEAGLIIVTEGPGLAKFTDRVAVTVPVEVMAEIVIRGERDGRRWG